MVVKDKVGRHRYILFFFKNKKIDSIVDRKFKLVFCKKNYGIIRCRHIDKDKVIEFLNKHGYKTIKTSGTIKKLKKLIESIGKNEDFRFPMAGSQGANQSQPKE